MLDSSRGFQAPDLRPSGAVAERHLPRCDRETPVAASPANVAPRRAALDTSPGPEGPGYRQASLRDGSGARASTL